MREAGGLNIQSMGSRMLKEAFNSLIRPALKGIRDVEGAYKLRLRASRGLKEALRFNHEQKLLVVSANFVKKLLKLRRDGAMYLLDVLTTYAFYRGGSADKFSAYLGEVGACWMARQRFLSLNIIYGDLEARRKLIDALNDLPSRVLGEGPTRALRLLTEASTFKELAEGVGGWPRFKEDGKVGLAILGLRGLGGLECLKEIIDGLDFRRLSLGGVRAFLPILLSLLPMRGPSWFSLKEELVAKLKPHGGRIEAIVGGGFINLINFLEGRSWEEVFIRPADDSLGDAVAMAEERIRPGPDGLFPVDGLNIILECYLERKLGVGKEEFRGGYVDREAVKGRILELLYEGRFIIYLNLLRSLKGHLDVAETFLSDYYLSRVAQLTIEGLAGELLAPRPLEICVKPLKEGDLAEHLRGEANMAVICGTLDNFFQNTLWDMAQDSFEYDLSRGARSINILGVHKDWLLVSQGRLMAERALLAGSDGRMREVKIAEPLTIHACLILNVPLRNESRLHEWLSSRISRLGIPLINPYQASRRAESKLDTHKLIEKFNGSGSGRLIHSPKYEAVADGSLKDISASLRRFLTLLAKDGREGPLTFIVKPEGGTEGFGVEGFSVEASSLSDVKEDHEAVRYIHKLLKGGGVLVEDCRGNVRYGGRRVSFRFNVSWNGSTFLVESGFAQVAKDEGAFVASPSRGGEIININAALRGLQLPKEGKVIRCKVGEEELEIMEGACVATAEALNVGLREQDFLKFMGVDFVLDAEEVEGKVRLIPFILEANPRPSGLVYLSTIVRPPSLGDGEANIFKGLLGYVEAQAKRYKESLAA